MPEIVRIFALGGLDEDGRNSYIIEAGDDIFVVEAGAKYPDSTKPGIDFVIPNYEYLIKNKKRVRAYIITHGHDDVLGALPYIYPHVPAPIYASKATIQMILDFTKRRKLNVDYNFKEINPSGKQTINNRSVHFFQTTHAMMLSSGFALKTEQGYIVYSGDFLVEYNANENYHHDLNMLAKIAEKDILALLSESEGAERPGYTSPDHRLTPNIATTFQDAKDRIFIALYNQSTYHLEEIIALVKKHNKKLYLYDQEVRDYFASFNKIDMLRIPIVNQLGFDDLLRARRSDIVVLMMAQGDSLYKQIETLAARENEDKRLVVMPEDTFIIAAPAAPNFEVLTTKVIDDLYRTGARVIEVKRKKLAPFHASEEDLKMMISLLKPKYYIPTKGEYKQMMANAILAAGMNINLSHRNIFLLDNGIIVHFENGKARLIAAGPDAVKVGDIYIDGTGVGDTSSGVLEDRSTLAKDGVIVMGVALSKKRKKIVSAPDIQMRGFVFVRDNDSIVIELTKILLTCVGEHLKLNTTINEEKLSADVFERARRYLWRETRREPMILPLITLLDL